MLGYAPYYFRVKPSHIYEMRINDENTARSVHKAILQMPILCEVQESLWRNTYKRFRLTKLVRVYA